MSDIHEHLLSVLRRLLQAKCRKPGTLVRLPQQSLIMICEIAKSLLSQEPFLAEISPPVKIVGDIHGQYYDLLRIFEECGSPPAQSYLFLGDYVDRGPQSIETMALLLVYKILYPEHIFLLRGNHECAEINEIHGFKSECMSRYSTRLWVLFNEVFAVMPIAASIGHKLFACHGGISPDIVTLDFFEKVTRPLPTVTGPLFDLIWSDPDPLNEGWRPNPRGKSFVFGNRSAHKFLDTLNFEILVRSHQAVTGGFGFPFEPDRSVVTVFSAPNGGSEWENNGSVMVINASFECSFVSIKPMERRLPAPRSSVPPIEEILGMRNTMTKSLSIKRR